MIIEKISIGGFANIKGGSFALSDINALVATNGYGKSNALKAICFGAEFISTSPQGKMAMMQDDTFLPINKQNDHQDFTFQIDGKVNMDSAEMMFCYGFSFSWNTQNLVSETLKMKGTNKQRYTTLITRSLSDSFLFMPSAGCRCNKNASCHGAELAVNRNDIFARLFYASLIEEIGRLCIPRLETMENPDYYFSTNRKQTLAFFDNKSANEYIFWLMNNQPHHYSIFKDGVMQILDNLESFEPYEAKVGEGLDSALYDIRIKDKYVTQQTSISRLSAGSKRIVFLFLISLTANIKGIPLIMLEEPENSVHPKLLENLVLLLNSYAEKTKLLFTSHSPYLARHISTRKTYFGLPNKDGLAQFAQIKEKKRKYLHQYASVMELTMGEFMFEFLLDIEDDMEKIEQFFDVQK